MKRIGIKLSKSVHIWIILIGRLQKIQVIEYSSFFFVCVCFLGDIQVGMMDKKGQLEVEIIRARGLVVKPGSKTLPGKEEKS